MNAEIYAGERSKERSGVATALALLVCASAFWASALWAAPGQHSAAASHRPAYVRPQIQERRAARLQARQQNQERRALEQENGTHPFRPAYSRSAEERPLGPQALPRPAYHPSEVPAAPVISAPNRIAPTSAPPNQARPAYAPAGHLGDWLSQHGSSPVQDQERMLRNEPSFKRLNPAEQQRVLQQLHQVNSLSEEQRERRLARAETLERLSPQERMQINASARRFAAMPPDRQALMKSAFRDLRSVPTDQRATVLNSSRYQGVFSPDERGVLSEILKAEPYEPVR